MFITKTKITIPSHRVPASQTSTGRRPLIRWGKVQSLIGALIIPFFVSASITKPIEESVAAAHQLAHLDYALKLSKRRNDETGILYDALLIIKDNLQTKMVSMDQELTQQHTHIRANLSNSFEGIGVINQNIDTVLDKTTHQIDAEGSLQNTAGRDRGHVVYVESAPVKRRNTTAGIGVSLDSGVSGAAGGWESGTGMEADTGSGASRAVYYPDEE